MHPQSRSCSFVGPVAYTLMITYTYMYMYTPLIAGICLHEVWFLRIHSCDHYKAYDTYVYLYSCIGSGGALDYVMKVSGFLSFSLCELSSWQEAGNTTILVLFMLKQTKQSIYNILQY